jgi:adenylate cyclase class IV
VPDLGAFVEIEAGNLQADLPVEKLRAQCDFYMQAFTIKEKELVEISNSEMLKKMAEIA